MTDKSKARARQQRALPASGGWVVLPAEVNGAGVSRRRCRSTRHDAAELGRAAEAAEGAPVLSYATAREARRKAKEARTIGRTWRAAA